MNENSAPQQDDDPTPIFGAYRRGYDPEKVDHYVAEQRRRLDESLHRANEAERRLAAAVGQLRELHRRVAVLESDERTPQTPAIDTLGERVQRILQEAWDGTYALRQSAEAEVSQLRDKAGLESEEIIEAAKKKAETIEAEINRRRRAYLQKIELERSKAVDQMTYLQGQRELAISELLRVKSLVEATVGEITGAEERDYGQLMPSEEDLDLDGTELSITSPALDDSSSEEDAAESYLDETLPLLHLPREAAEREERDASMLVRDHRASQVTGQSAERDGVEGEVQARPSAKLFDFENEQS